MSSARSVSRSFGRTVLSTSRRLGRLSFCILATCLVLPGLGNAAANSLEATIREQKQISQEAAQSQQRINETFKEARQLLGEYKRSLRELENQRQYNDYLERMAQTQDASIRSTRDRLEAAHLTPREVLPLMTRMVETLKRFVELDTPFLLEERRGRVAALTATIDDPKLSLGEKYRRILEAYQIETEYGRTLEAYRGTQPLGDQERVVDFLRVGRIALLYRSPDGAETGFWDKSAQSWKPLPDAYRASLAKGLRVAQKQSAPELLRIPVPAPEVLP